MTGGFAMERNSHRAKVESIQSLRVTANEDAIDH